MIAGISMPFFFRDMTRLSELNILEYIVDNTEFDTSDFILLTTKFLKKRDEDYLKSDASYQTIRPQLEKVSLDYLKHDYLSALNRIGFILKEHDDYQDFEIIKLNVFTVISDFIHLNDDPAINKSRRYFDTKLAKKIKLTMTDDELGSLSIITDYLAEVVKEKIGRRIEDYQLPQTISTIEDVHLLNLALRVIVEDCEELESACMALSKQMEPFNNKQRKDRELSSPTVTNIPGVLRWFEGVPFDELSDVRNKIVDQFEAPRTVTGASADTKMTLSYTETRPYVPFVASISGTMRDTIYVVSKAIEGAIGSIDSVELQRCANVMLKCFLFDACLSGWHSLGEMLDVFDQPVMQLSLKLDVRYQADISPSLVLESMLESADYIHTMINRQRVLNDACLNSKHDGALKPSEVIAEPSILKSKIELDEYGVMKKWF